MKTLNTILTAVFLSAGVSAASAQGTTRQMDEQAGGNSGAVERNPNGTIGGSKANPSPAGRARRANVHRRHGRVRHSSRS
jgi:pectate lyase